MMPATRMRAERDWDLRSPATSPARMAGISRLATARWAACARRCGFRCERLLLAAGQQRLQLVDVLDVQLEAAARHHDIAGLLIRFAGSQPFRLDLGHSVARHSLAAKIAMRDGRDRIG